MLFTEHIVRITDGSARQSAVILIGSSSHIVIHIFYNIISGCAVLACDAHVLDCHITLTLELLYRIAFLVLIASGSETEQQVHYIGGVIHLKSLGKLGFIYCLYTSQSVLLTGICILCADPAYGADGPCLAHGGAGILDDPDGINIQLIVGIILTVLHLRDDLYCRHVTVIFVCGNCEGLRLSCSETIGGHLLVGQYIRAAAILKLQSEEELILTAAVSV